MSVRQERLAEAMKKDLSDILRVMKDPRIGLASIVNVEVTRDLRHAKVYVSVFGDEDEQAASLAALIKAQGFIRSEMAKVLSLRYTPEIRFFPDQSIAHGARIADLLRTIAPAPAVDSAPEDAADGDERPGEGQV